MAKKKDTILIKTKAKVYLKYDKECKAVGEELSVRVEDALNMAEKGYIELLEELPKEEEDMSKDGE